MHRPRFRPHFASYLLALSASCLLAAPDQEGKTYVDPGKVDDPDFAIQGEYLGKADDQPWGLQLVALGGGLFDFVAYPGGLPGEGWDGGDRLKGSGKRQPENVLILTAKPDNGSRALVKDGEIKLFNGDAKEPFGNLKKVERKSPTLGQEPPTDALVLFDGENADAWTGSGDLIDDGLLVQGVTSKERFQDFHLHLEFRTPFKPKARGQGRGNSGFYAQGRYEVQILDSFGLEPKDNECGGIYSVGAPAIPMCYPPLTWQTYDVDFRAARYDDEGKKTEDAKLTVRHNGVLIHDAVVADHATTAAPLPEGPEPGPIFLQDHGNPVRFRNIWVQRQDTQN